MVKVETRKMTPVLRGSQMLFNKDFLNECGLSVDGKYVVVYEEGKITIAKELKSVEVKTVEKIE